MVNISSIAANRYLIKLQKNACYCECSLVEAYSRFTTNSTENISFSSFYKCVGDEFKKPHRFSDLCEYCEKNKVTFLNLIIYFILIKIIFHSFKQLLKQEMSHFLSSKGYPGEMDDTNEIADFLQNISSINIISQ